jgi:hypothetical protein
MDLAQILSWMTRNGDELRALLEAETRQPGADDTPAGDPAIRAHLRFLARALEENGDDRWGGPLRGFPDGLVEWFADSADLFDEHLAAGEGAMLLEAHLQWGTRPGVDPSLDAAQERRLRLLGWVRIFLLGLEGHLGHGADGLYRGALDWMDGRQRDLGRMVAGLDAQASFSAGHAAGSALDTDMLDRIGQVVVVQAYVRHVAEAACACLNGLAGPETNP